MDETVDSIKNNENVMQQLMVIPKVDFTNFIYSFSTDRICALHSSILKILIVHNGKVKVRKGCFFKHYCQNLLLFIVLLILHKGYLFQFLSKQMH